MNRKLLFVPGYLFFSLAILLFFSTEVLSQAFSYSSGALSVDVFVLNPCSGNNGAIRFTINSTEGGADASIAVFGPVNLFPTQSVAPGNSYTFNPGMTLPAGSYGWVLGDGTNTVGSIVDPVLYPAFQLTSITSPTVNKDLEVNNSSCTTPDGQVQASITGGSQSLPGGGSYTYTWTSTNGLAGLPLVGTTDGTTPLNLATLLGLSGLRGGDYTINLSDNYSRCSTSTTFTITDPSPVVQTITTPSPLAICVGDDITITLNNSQSSVTYEILRNGVSLPSPITFLGTGSGPFAMTFPSSQFLNGNNILVQAYEGFCSIVAMNGSVNLTINPLPTVSNVSGGGTVCSTDPLPDVTFQFTGTAPFNFTYTDGVTNFPIAGHPTNTYTITNAPAGTYQVLSLQDNNGCNATVLGGSVQVIVNPAATANAGADAPMCSGDSYALVGSTVGGSATTGAWSIVSQPVGGDGVLSNTAQTATPATVTLTASVVGVYTLRLTTNDPAGPCIAVSDDVLITVEPAATVDAGAPQTICSDGTATLAGTIGGSASSSTWTTSGDGAFNDATLLNAIYTPGPNDLTAGTVTLTLTTDDPAGSCPAVSDNVVITINAAATVDAGPVQTICSGSTVTLAGVIGGGASSATWTTSGDGAFNNASLLNAIYTPGANDLTAGTVTLTLTTNDPAGPCGSVNDNVVITIEPAATVDAGAPQTICSDGTATLAGTIGGSASSSTWTTSGDGAFNDATLLNAIYTPGPNDLTAGTVTLTLTTNDPAGSCPAVSDNVVITINAAATVDAGPVQTICSGSTVTLAGVIGGGASSATWTTSGDGAFNNASLLNAIYTPGANDLTAGTVTLTLTTNDPAGPCGSVNDNVVITIEPAATVDAGAPQTICSDGTATLAGTIGGSASSSTWTTSGDGAFNDATLLNAIYTPGPNDLTAGTVTLTLTTDDPAGSCPAVSDNVVITINAAATVDAGPVQTICSGSTVTLAGVIGGGASSATWTTSGDGTFNNASLLNAIYTPGANDLTAGTVTLTLTTNDPAGPCGSVNDNVVITIEPAATVDAGAPQTICSDGTATLAGTIGGSAGSSTWTTSGDGTFSDASLLNAIYTPGPNDLTAGTVTLTLTTDDPAGSCPAVSDNVVITINAAATVDAGPVQTICSGSTVTLAGAIGGGASSATWTTSGDGGFNNASLLNAIYTPGANDLTAGTVTLTLTTNDPAGPCGSANDNVVITIEPAATVDAGAPQTICSDGTATLAGTIGGSASGSTWTTSGDGTFSDATLLNAIYTPGPNDLTAGTVTLTLTTDDPAGSCPAVSDNVVITINAIPTVNAGADANACAGGFVTLNGTRGGGATSSIWTTSGDGTFTNVLSLTPNYTPGLNDIANGNVTLTLTTNDPAGPCIAASDDVDITIISGPDAALTVNVSVSPLCIGGSTTITVDNSEVGVSYQLRDDSDDSPVQSPVVGNGGTIALSTGALGATTTFNILASLAGCTSVELTNKATVTVAGNINAGLAVSALVNPVCNGSSTSIRITNSENGVLYQLRNDAGDVSIGAPQPGNGGNLDIPTGALAANTTFNVLASNGTCSVELTDLETVTIQPSPDPNLPVSVTLDPVCDGGSSDVLVSNSQVGVTYQLRDDDGDIPVGAPVAGTGGTISLPTGPLNKTTIFNVLVTTGGACTPVELTTLVTVNVVGVVDATLAVAPVDDPLCEGTGTFIRISGSEIGVNYQLRNDAGDVNIGPALAGTGGDLDLPTGNLSTTSTFNVLANNGTCSIELSSLAVVNVDVNPNPGLTVSATIDPLCTGGVSGIQIQGSQLGVSYQLRNDADDSNVLSPVAGTGGTIVLPTDVLNATTTFNVLATGGTTCPPIELTSTVTVTVTGTLNAGLVTTASPATICAGSSAFVQVESSEAGINYQLRLDSDDSTIGSAVVGNGGTISLPTGNLNTTTTFNVLAGNGACSIELTDKETVTVDPTPDIALSVTATSGLICSGTQTTIVVQNSEAGVSYQLRNGATPVGAPVAGTGGNISLPTGPLASNTTFNVFATIGSCSAQLTATPTVSIRPPGDPACGGGGIGCFAYTILVVDAQTQRPSCADQDDGVITLDITGTTAGNYVIQLISPTDTLTQVGPSGIYTFTNLSAANYSYKVQDALGNICQQPYDLPLATVVQVTASNPVDAICFGAATGRVTLTITGGNSPYEYSLDGATWTSVLSGGTIDNLPSSGTYPILVRDDNTDLCPAEVLVTINSVNPEIQATFDVDEATCAGGDGGITISSTSGGSGSGYEYSLNGGTFGPGPFLNLDGGSYTVTIRDNIGCTKDFNVDVTFPGFINHNVIAQNTDCNNNGRSGSITLSIADAGVFEVALSTDQFNEPTDEEYNNYNAPSVTFSDLERGTYYVYMRSGGVSCATRTAPIVIQGAYAINFDIEPVCTGNELSISITNITGEPGLPIEIQIYKKFTNVQVDNIQVASIPPTNSYLIDYATHVFLQSPGEYQIQIVQVQSTFCLLSSDLVDYTVPVPLFASIGETTESYPDILNGSMQILNFSGPGPDYMTYIRLDSASVPGQFFDAGPDVVPLNQNNDFEIVYDNIPAGRYEVIVTDKNGCSKTLIARVPLDTDIFIPNIFTPNGDGANDVFFIRNLPESNANLVVTNRWGGEVFTTSNYQNNWDGGNAVDGVYFYRLKVSGNEPITGWVEILRGVKP
ncbi:MAG TPA: gliding motility-associated C-terminal domain-containing protein [Cyclobacteriaceae bacterium]|nr:gliding motility-associated C-terminal domain-containing protein [Cyclobacteriaceae bacterium]